MQLETIEKGLDQRSKFLLERGLDVLAMMESERMLVCR